MEKEYVIEQEGEKMTREQKLKVTGMDMLLRKFSRMPDSESVTVKEIIAASNMVYDEIISNDGEDQQVNMFKKPMTEQEQLELSDLLDKFLQMYENGFADQLTGDTDDDADNLKYEFGQLYNLVKMLSDRALD